MAAKFPRSIFDFLRLAPSWLRIVAASGANFSESVAVGAEFSLSEDLSAPIFSRSTRSLLKQNSLSSTERKLPNAIGNLGMLPLMETVSYGL